MAGLAGRLVQVAHITCLKYNLFERHARMASSDGRLGRQVWTRGLDGMLG